MKAAGDSGSNTPIGMPGMKLESLFSKVVDLKTVKKAVIKKASLKAVALKSQMSDDSFAEPKDPFDTHDIDDDARKSPTARRNLKWSRTLIHSMRINKESVSISYTDQGLKVIDPEEQEQEDKEAAESASKRKQILYGKEIDRDKRKSVLFADKKGKQKCNFCRNMSCIPNYLDANRQRD